MRQHPNIVRRETGRRAEGPVQPPTSGGSNATNDPPPKGGSNQSASTRSSIVASDIAAIGAARRLGYVLLALLEVWCSAVGDHIADEEGGEIYNALKCAADVLLHLKYVPADDARNVERDVLNGDKV